MKTETELRHIVKSLEPKLRDAAPKAEEECNLPAETVELLRDAGLFRIWVPKCLGGWEIDPVTACQIFESIALIDSAAAWCVQMSNAITCLGRFFTDEAVKEVFANGNPLMADAFHPAGQVIDVKDGYEFSGHFTFASNCLHADWFIALGVVMKDGQPVMDSEQPILKMLVFPMSEAKVIENWDTLGMRGTGSHDVSVDKLFVPSHRAVTLAPIEKANNTVWPQTFNNLSIWNIIASIGTTPMGIASAALAEFIDVAKAKTAAYQSETVNQHCLSHYRLGQAHVTLCAAKANFYDALSNAWSTAATGSFITIQQKCDLQIAASYAARTACDAIELLSASAGANAFRHSSSLDRHLRDLRTITQHAFISTDRYEDVGALMLGQTQKWGFLNF